MDLEKQISAFLETEYKPIYQEQRRKRIEELSKIPQEEISTDDSIELVWTKNIETPEKRINSIKETLLNIKSIYTKQLLSYLPDLKNKKIIDIGARNGSSSFDMIASGGIVTIVEPYPFTTRLPEEIASKIYKIFFESKFPDCEYNIDYKKSEIQNFQSKAMYDLAVFFFPDYNVINNNERMPAIIQSTISHLKQSGEFYVFTEQENPQLIGSPKIQVIHNRLGFAQFKYSKLFENKGYLDIREEITNYNFQVIKYVKQSTECFK